MENYPLFSFHENSSKDQFNQFDLENSSNNDLITFEDQKDLETIPERSMEFS